jgi:hypothetical protein
LQRAEPHRGIEPRSPAWKAGTSPLNACEARWVPQVTILPAPGFQPGANPSQLETRGRAGRIRTDGLVPHARALSQAELQPGVVGSPGVEPGFTPSRTGWISVFLEPGGEGRNRTGSSTLAGRDRTVAAVPKVDRPGLEQGTSAMQGAALPVGAGSPQPPLPERRPVKIGTRANVGTPAGPP